MDYKKLKNLINWDSVNAEDLYNLGGLNSSIDRVTEAEQMYQRALHGYEKALGPDNIINYVPALNTIWNFGSLFECQADIAKARAMYSKASLGYEQVFGPEYPESQSSRHKLCQEEKKRKKVKFCNTRGTPDSP